MVVLATLNAKSLGDPAKFVGNRGDGNLGLIGLGPASRVFTCSLLLDSLLIATTKISICPHTTSYPNRLRAQVKEFSVEEISMTFRNRVLNRFYVREQTDCIKARRSSVTKGTCQDQSFDQKASSRNEMILHQQNSRRLLRMFPWAMKLTS